MCFVFFRAVVERIAKFPFGGEMARACLVCRKGIISGQNSCNITWGYVASSTIAVEWGQLSIRGVGGWRGERLENFEQVSRNGLQVSVG